MILYIAQNKVILAVLLALTKPFYKSILYTFVVLRDMCSESWTISHFYVEYFVKRFDDGSKEYFQNAMQFRICKIF